MFHAPVAIDRGMFGVSVSPPGPAREERADRPAKGDRGRPDARPRPRPGNGTSSPSYETLRPASARRGPRRHDRRSSSAARTSSSPRPGAVSWRRSSPAFGGCRRTSRSATPGTGRNGASGITREYLELARPAVRARARIRRPARRARPSSISSSISIRRPLRAPAVRQGQLAPLRGPGRRARRTPSSAGRRPRRWPCSRPSSDRSGGPAAGCWITEVNWPLEGTGKYSPASGKPNVTEEEQADYLVRYYRPRPGRRPDRAGLLVAARRPRLWAHRQPRDALAAAAVASRAPDDGRHGPGAEFTGRPTIEDGVHIFRFRKDGRHFAVCWTIGAPVERDFERPVPRSSTGTGATRPPIARASRSKGVRSMSSSHASPPRSKFTAGGVRDYERTRYRGLDQRIVHAREDQADRRPLDEASPDAARAAPPRFLDLPCGYGRFTGRSPERRRES